MCDCLFDSTLFRTFPKKLARLARALGLVGLMGAALTSPGHAQATVDLLTAADFGVLGASTVTNTGPTVINGLLGVSPGAAITGFPPGTATAQHAADAVALQAQADLSAAYLDALSRPTTVNLTGQNLGSLTLVPGVYNFNSSVQLTGTLTLNGLGNPNSVFIFNIGSTLTTASASVVSLINSAQGGNAFFQGRQFRNARHGHIVHREHSRADEHHTKHRRYTPMRSCLATHRCGDVGYQHNHNMHGHDRRNRRDWRNRYRHVLGPTGVPLFISLLPTSADNSQRAVANALDTYVGNGGTLTLDFLNLYNLSPTELASAFSQLQGEAGAGIAQAGTQAMNSFLSLVTNPFNNNRPFALNRPPSEIGPRMPLKARGYAPEGPSSPARAVFDSVDSIAFGGERRWGVWGAGYGGQNITTGDASSGTQDRTARIELGSWFDTSYILDNNSTLSLFGRAAWAHDWSSDPSVTATFLLLRRASFTEFGAAPVHNSLLASAGAQISFRNGISLAGWFDGEFAEHSQSYGGTAQLRYKL